MHIHIGNFPICQCDGTCNVAGQPVVAAMILLLQLAAVRAAMMMV